MASGIELMMRSMGVNPDAIKASLIEAKDALEAKINGMDAKLSYINDKVDTLMMLIMRLEDGIKHGAVESDHDAEPQDVDEKVLEALNGNTVGDYHN